MWIFLWVVLSIFVFGIFFWSTAILQQQKKAWAAFAKKMGFIYEGGAFSDPPVIRGTLKNRQIVFYTDERRTSDARGKRFITAIETEMGPGMPTAAALATPDYNEFLSTMRLTQTFKPQVEGWNPDNIIKVQDAGVVASYFTPERLKALQGLFAMKNAATMLFFDEQECVLRIETSDPLTDADRMEKIARRLVSVADVILPLKTPPMSAPETTPQEPPK